MTATGPVLAVQAPSAGFDPYADRVQASPIRFLYGLNPLAKLGAPLPAMLLLVFVRDAATPAAFLLLSYAILLVGVSFTRRLVGVLLALPLAAAAIGFGFSLWTDPSKVDQSVVIWQIGSWTLYGGALAVGLATGLRIAAIVALALIAGLSTTGPDVVRASVQQLRVPYRIGYTALAAFRFVPRFGHELEVIRQAHRVRGAHGGRGPFSALARWFGYIVPLMAGAIRHAERVALAMDARAFGAHPDRTERHLVPFRARDVVFIALFLVASAAIFTAFFPWGSVTAPDHPTDHGGTMALTSRLVKPANQDLLHLTVLRTERLSPHWMRITLGGGEIDASGRWATTSGSASSCRSAATRDSSASPPRRRSCSATSSTSASPTASAR